MNVTRCLAVLQLALVLGCGAVRGQTEPDDTTPAAPAAGSTVITSDQLHSDDNTHISVFTGNVIVDGTNFKLTCEEMTVLFDKDNKVVQITAVGNVVITQPDRITHCGHADYYKADDRFVLTENPVIDDHKNQLSAPKITIYRTSQKILTDGGRSHTIIGPDSMKSTETGTNTAELPK